MTTLEALPKNGDVQGWSDQERALVEAAGLVSRGNLAPRPTVEAFLQHCRRTGLDPIARQIYAIERGGKWGIQISIDGARVVAERSGKYRGQTPVQWTADGDKWVEVWLAKTPPAAARVGVHKDGFVEPLMAVATWDQYAQANGPMWKKMPALMLAKCAESLALRQAFPQDLSGLYTSEEMDQAGGSRQPTQSPSPAPSAPVEAVVVEDPPFDVVGWMDQLQTCTTVDGLRDLYNTAKTEGALQGVMDAAGSTLNQMIMARKKRLLEQAAVSIPDDEPVSVPDEPVSDDNAA